MKHLIAPQHLFYEEVTLHILLLKIEYYVGNTSAKGIEFKQVHIINNLM